MTTPKGRDVPPKTSPHTPGAITAILGGVEYVINPRPIASTRQWKQGAEPIIDELLGMITMIPGSDPAAAPAPPGVRGAANTLASVPVHEIYPFLLQLKSKLLYATDTVLDLVCSYAPELAADRERIEEEAYESEVLAVFGEIVRLVFPLEQWKKALSGRGTTPISSNSPATNGALQRVK